MKRSMLRRMSSTPLVEFNVDEVVVEQPEKTQVKTGETLLYQVHNVQKGPDGSDLFCYDVEGPYVLVPIVEDHPRLRETLNVSIIPLMPGEYRLKISYRTQLFFTGNLFSVTGPPIDAESIVKKAKVVGRQSELGQTARINEFTLDTTECPSRVGGLVLSMKGITPRIAARLYLTDHQNGIYTIGYKPTSAGRYRLSVKLAGLHVPGSPFQIEVHD